MEKKVELALLMDFYGPLLTPHRREVLSLYCEEDMSFQEIADQLGITRQGAHDAARAAEAQLLKYEQTLSLLSRYQRITREVDTCRACLKRIIPDESSRHALSQALDALDRIDRIER